MPWIASSPPVPRQAGKWTPQAAGFAGRTRVDLGVRGDLRVVLPPVHLAGSVSADIGVRGGIRFSKYLAGSVTPETSVYGRVRLVSNKLVGRVSTDVGARGALAVRIRLTGRVSDLQRVRGDLRVPTFPHFFPRPVAADVGARGNLRIAFTPPNDAFANAVTLTGDTGQFDTSNEGATLEAGEPTAGFASPVTDRTIWYSWTAEASGSTVFAVFAARQVGLDVFTGSSVGALTTVATDVNSVRFDTVAGTTYRVRVGAGEFDRLSGPLTLGWTLTRTPPVIVALAGWTRDQSQRFLIELGVVAALRVRVPVVPPPRSFDPLYDPSQPDSPASIARREEAIRVHRYSLTFLPPTIVNGFPEA